MKRRAIWILGLLALVAAGFFQPGPFEVLQRERNLLSDFAITIAGEISGLPNDGKDDSAAYYRARSILLANGIYHLEIGAGKWTFNQPLVVTAGTSTNFQSFKISGVGSNSYDDPNASATTLDFTGMAATKGAAIMIQGARGVVLEDLNIEGRNAAPLTLGLTPTDTESDWVDSGESISTDRYAPYAGIVIDPFSGSKAATYYTSPTDPNTSATLLAYGTTPAQASSANIHINRVNIFGFVAAICNKPSDDDTQTENCSVTNCNLRGNTYAFSNGCSQARGWTFNNVEMQYCMTAMTGAQHGKRTGVCPNVFGGDAFRCYNIFEFPGGYGNINVNGFYAETFKTIGYFGTGNTAQSYSANLTGCGFRFDSTGSEPASNHPVHLYTYMPTTITGGYIETRGGVLNVVGSTVTNKNRVLFDSVQFRGAPTSGWNDVYYTCRRKDWAAPTPEFRGCNWMTDYWTSSFAPACNTQNDYLTLPSRIEFSPWAREVTIPQKTYRLKSGAGNSYVSSTITAASWTDSDSVDLTASTPTEFAVGDVLFWRLNAATRAGSTVYDVPCLKVTAINSSTITCDAIYNPDLINKTYQTGGGTALICQREYALGDRVTGATTSSSTSVTGVTSASSYFRTGDFIAGVGIPAKTRVTNVSGTTVTISKAATASGTVELYYGTARQGKYQSGRELEDFGVTGDGSTDDTTALNNWLAANPTYAMLPKPAVYYKVSGIIDVLDSQTLVGEGKLGTIIRPTTTYASTVLRLGTDSVVRDIGLNGQDFANSVGIQPGSTEARWVVENCDVENFDTGILIDSNAEMGTVRNTRVHSCPTNGLLVSANAQGLLVDRSDFTSSARGINITGSLQDGKIWACRVGSNSTHGIDVTGGTLALSILGCHLDSNTGADINLASVSQKATAILSNRCVTTPTSIQLALADNTVIRGNSLGGATAPISITNIGAQRTEIGVNDWTVVAFDYATMNAGFATSYLGKIYASGTPDGTGPWEAGEIVLNSATSTSPGTPMGWNCTTGHASAATFTPFYRAPQIIVGSTTWDPGSLATGASEGKDVSVSGATVGAVALAGHTAMASGMTLDAEVISSSVVRVTLTNVNATNPTDLSSGTISVQVFQ